MIWKQVRRHMNYALECIIYIASTLIIAYSTHTNPSTGRTVGFVADSNLFGLVILPVIVWGVSLTIRLGATNKLVWAAAIFLIFNFTILATAQSRAAILCAGVALIWYLGRISPTPRRFLPACASVVILLTLLGIAYAPLRERILESFTGVDLSLQNRWIQMRRLLGLLHERPLGVGWENISVVWCEYLRPDNMNTVYGAAPWPLELGTQAGLGALWLVLSLVILGMARKPRTRLHGIASAALVGLSIGGLSKSFLMYPIANSVYIFVLGIALAPGSSSDGRLLIRSLGVGCICTAGLWVGGLASLPATSWRATAKSSFVLSSRSGLNWVLVDLRETESAARWSGLGFARQIAEAGGAYYRTIPAGDTYCVEACQSATRYHVPLILLIDEHTRRDVEASLRSYPWDAVITMRQAVVFDPVQVEYEPDDTLAPQIKCWSILTANAEDLAIPRDRLCATLIVQILQSLNEPVLDLEPCKTPLIQPSDRRKSEHTDHDTSNHVLSRERVAALIKNQWPDADGRTLMQETYLAWKVRDRFYHNIDPNIYFNNMLRPSVNDDLAEVDWRKRFYLYYYPLVWGTPDETLAVRRIVDHACWTTVVMGNTNPWGRPIRTAEDMAAYVTMACHAVGIATRPCNCETRQGCVQYYNDNKNCWECAEVGAKWKLLQKVNTLAQVARIQSVSH